MEHEDKFSPLSPPNDFEKLRKDLLHFHSLHFPNANAPMLSHASLGFNLSNQETQQHRNAEVEHDEHGEILNDHITANHVEPLGYYDDGTERTLTDEQIRIFRHTEIQELLKERKSTGAVGKNTTEEAELHRQDSTALQPSSESSGSPAISLTQPELDSKDGQNGVEPLYSKKPDLGA